MALSLHPEMVKFWKPAQEGNHRGKPWPLCPARRPPRAIWLSEYINDWIHPQQFFLCFYGEGTLYLPDRCKAAQSENSHWNGLGNCYAIYFHLFVHVIWLEICRQTELNYSLYSTLVTPSNSFIIIASLDSHLPSVTSPHYRALGKCMFRSAHFHFTFTWTARRKTSLVLEYLCLRGSLKGFESHAMKLWKAKQSLCLYVCILASHVGLSETRFKGVNSQIHCI